MKNLGSIGNSGRLSTDQENNEDGEITRFAISTLEAREEEIERKMMEVKEKVDLQLGRAEEETRRLAQIWEVGSTKQLISSMPFLFFTLLLIKLFLISWICKTKFYSLCFEENNSIYSMIYKNKWVAHPSSDYQNKFLILDQNKLLICFLSNTIY